ncbi:hypothetical protein B0H11DRAFT_2430967 [Mycena galericulata]|nr:hypothetical protein B0H11DRAFT_2430967 [Mycena galericulata]
MSEESSDKMGRQWTDLRSKVRTWVRRGASGSCGSLWPTCEFSEPSQPSHNPASGTELQYPPMDSEILHIVDSDTENNRNITAIFFAIFGGQKTSFGENLRSEAKFRQIWDLRINQGPRLVQSTMKSALFVLSLSRYSPQQSARSFSGPSRYMVLNMKVRFSTYNILHCGWELRREETGEKHDKLEALHIKPYEWTRLLNLFSGSIHSITFDEYSHISHCAEEAQHTFSLDMRSTSTPWLAIPALEKPYAQWKLASKLFNYTVFWPALEYGGNTVTLLFAPKYIPKSWRMDSPQTLLKTPIQSSNSLQPGYTVFICGAKIID